MQDNPGMSFDDAKQVAGQALNGEDVGLSGNSAALLDFINKRRTNSSLSTSAINAKQADAEIDTLSKLSTEWNKPYGDTYMNMSPAQVVDTFKNDEESQTRLGKFIAAQQLQNEIAQIETRLAMGQPGITNTHDLMQLGMQQINAKYPMLSQKARAEAQKQFIYALKKGLESRQKVGINVSSAFSKSPPVQEPNSPSQQEQPSSPTAESPSPVESAPKDQQTPVQIDEEGNKVKVNPNVSQSRSISRGLKLPKFSNQKEFQEWYARQPDVVKSAVALHLKSKRGNQ